MLESFTLLAEGLLERSRDLVLEARARYVSIEHAYGMVACQLGAAHVEYRMHDYDAARWTATEAVTMADTFEAPRRSGGALLLLGMIGIDTNDLEAGRSHAERALALFAGLSDPWGIVEAKLLHAQLALAAGQLDQAQRVLSAAAEVDVEEFEPRQHLHLTQAWHAQLVDDRDAAAESFQLAVQTSKAFTSTADHTPYLLERLAEFSWPPDADATLTAWRDKLSAAKDQRRHADDPPIV